MQATTAADLFAAPRFRPGVQLIEEHNGLTLDYREQSCSVVADSQDVDAWIGKSNGRDDQGV